VRSSEGLVEVCQILFGDEAEDRLAEYLASRDAATTPAPAPAQQ
jgi:hypothetical protein